MRHTSPPNACQGPGFNRREALQAGGLGALGLTLPQLLRAEGQTAAKKKDPLFGRAKSCMIVFLSGGFSHHDTWDMKPDAPEEIRGTFQEVATNVPGINICEHLPYLARQADKYAVVRSLAHLDTNHPSGCYWMMTGHPYHRGIGSGLSENISREDHPHIGSALSALEGPHSRQVPTFVTVPDYIAVGGPIRAGQHGGFLGSKYDPLVPRGNPNSDDFQTLDLGLTPSVTSARLDSRKALLGSINQQAWARDRLAAGQSLDNYYEKAFGILNSGITQKAFDIYSEPAAVRDRYGRHQFGQSVLLGRRLVEAGVRLVHVNWIRIREFGWDTHADNFNELQNKLLPPMDVAVSALLDDMQASGLLDETLVILMSEFGRSPKITAANAGREHWPFVFTAVLAGAGLPVGRHYGASDRVGAYPRENPITPGELAATIYYALGVEPHSQLTTVLQRPWQICEDQPVFDLWRAS